MPSPTLFHEMIHIMPGCAMHLHGHYNKMVPFMKPSIFTNFNNGLNFVVAFVDWVMTLIDIVSRFGSITTTLAIKT
jgi:hypothetical protein